MVEHAPPAFVIAPSADWAPTVRFANRLLRGGRRVLIVAGPLPGAEAGPPPGSCLIPLSPAWGAEAGEPGLAETLRAEAAAAGVELVPHDSSAAVLAAPLAPVRVGLYGGGGSPFNHAAVLAACGFPLRFLTDAEIRAGELATVDVLVVPGGGLRAMHGQLEPLGDDGCRAIAEFVRRGGMYVGCCAGAYDCIVNSGAFVAGCPAQRHLQLINAGPWRAVEAVEFLDLQSPGVGVVTVRNVRPDHPVMFGMPPEFAITHYNGPVLDPLTERVIDGASAATGLAEFAGWTPRFTPAEAFAGPLAGDEPTYLARAVAAGRFAIAAGELGTGRVVAFGSHPEFGLDLPLAEWSDPARLLANAILWQAMSGRAAAVAWGYGAAPGPVGLPRGASAAAVERAAAEVLDRARSLRARPIEPRPHWLAPEYALSVFGYPPEAIWRTSLDDMANLAGEIARLAGELRDRLETLGEVLPDGPLRDAAAQAERWILDERPAAWEQDSGYQGVLGLLRTAVRMADEAVARWDAPLGPPAGPYAYAETSPYHLVAGSYLAAVGGVVGALQLMRALVSELDLARQLAAAPAAAVAI